ncbi:MAG: helix-turn-helix domain-containing protein [gamma proteobacterium symbiont of Clathrolucina costata]
MRLSNEQRARALGMLDAGTDQTAVAAAFGVHKSTISRLLQRYRTAGTVNDRQRSGRPRVTTLRQDRAIRLVHLRNRFKTATMTARETPGHNRPAISRDTVLRRLREFDIRCRRPYVGTPLTAVNRRRRLRWANQHRRFLVRQWRNILFTDEVKVMIDFNDRRQRVFRRRGERHADACVKEVDRFGKASAMVWGGISHFGKTNLVFINQRGLWAQGRNGRQRQQGLTARRYIDDVLRPVVVPYLAAHPGMVLQQDNARPHTARITSSTYSGRTFKSYHGLRIQQT